MGALTWLIPPEAGVAIILWIGVIITAQAFEVTPRRHLVAVVVGLFPGIAAWTMLVVKDFPVRRWIKRRPAAACTPRTPPERSSAAASRWSRVSFIRR